MEEHIFNLGKDSSGRDHFIKVHVQEFWDGTKGLALVAMKAGTFSLRPGTSTEVHVTTHRPDRMPPKEIF